MDAQGIGNAIERMIQGVIIIALAVGITIGVCGFYMVGCIKGEVARSREKKQHISEACGKYPDLKLCEEEENGQH